MLLCFGSEITLDPYQSDLAEHLRRELVTKSVALLHATTGCGKSLIARYVAPVGRDTKP